MFFRSVFSTYFNEGNDFTQGSASEVITESLTNPHRCWLTVMENLFFFLFSLSNVMAGESFCLTVGFLLLPRAEQAHLDLAVVTSSYATLPWVGCIFPLPWAGCIFSCHLGPGSIAALHGAILYTENRTGIAGECSTAATQLASNLASLGPAPGSS